MKTFRELVVWQKAHQLAMEIYRMTKNFPPDERFGLVAQMRRASVSVAANIAEGHRRRSRREFLHFLTIAHGSLDELQYYLILSFDLKHLAQVPAERGTTMAEEVGRMLNGLESHIREETRHG